MHRVIGNIYVKEKMDRSRILDINGWSFGDVVLLTERTMEVLKELLFIPGDQRIVFYDDYDSRIGGQFDLLNQHIYLNMVHFYPERFVETICHEAVHAEQMFTGRLAWMLYETGYYIEYENTLHQITKIDCSGGIYDNKKAVVTSSSLPWEVEAYERQTPLKEIVLRAFKGMKYDYPCFR